MGGGQDTGEKRTHRHLEAGREDRGRMRMEEVLDPATEEKDQDVKKDQGGFLVCDLAVV